MGEITETKYKCDICSKIYNNDILFKYVQFKWNEYWSMPIGGGMDVSGDTEKFKEFYICDACYKMLRNETLNDILKKASIKIYSEEHFQKKYQEKISKINNMNYFEFKKFKKNLYKDIDFYNKL